MTCMRPVRICPGCGDVLIHQSNRGPHESSSSFGQFVHGLPNEMFWSDIDGVIYRKRTGVLRIIEHKAPGGGLSKGQEEILPLISKSIQLLAGGTGLVHEQSGVFVVHSEPPHATALVAPIRGWPMRPKLPAADLSGHELRGFLMGELFDTSTAARLAG